ncbi:hypothetical protein BGZ61DRAFT_487128 [Ilyonectria robusta]|uniref:uncharacterized protein n=1 Tax=Ilyonectria robusta TaxID=1079257 RepID=UPI001E8E2ACD|nr:uncharacterized protein BGZ61DRAFT_487128 [Ilyonectria robusta]KAH8654244.1 hypothetical protein BGZ61DRAFT_487128 [Ilyonectria robusta]
MENEAACRGDPMDWRGDRQSVEELNQILTTHLGQVRDIIKKECQTIIGTLECAAIPEQRSSTGFPGGSLTRKLSSRDGPGPAAAPATDQAPLPGASLEREVDDLKVRLATKESELDQARSQVKDATDKQENMKRQLFQEQYRAKELQDKLANLRGILTKAPSGIILDGDVQAKFMEVRNLAHMVVRKLYSRERISSAGDRSNESRSFFEPFVSKRIPSQYFENRFRGKVFDILDENLLSRPQFGLGHKDHKLERRLTEIEQDWKNLQIAVRYPREMADWRLATLKCVELMRTEPDAPKETFERIWDFMLPALTTNHEDEERGRAALVKLCEEAYSLAIMTRKSRDTFIMEKPPHRALLSEWTDCVEEFAHESIRHGEFTGKIQFCLFGGLSKIPEEHPGAKIVLEKAQVVVIGT